MLYSSLDTVRIVRPMIVLVLPFAAACVVPAFWLPGSLVPGSWQGLAKVRMSIAAASSPVGIQWVATCPIGITPRHSRTSSSNQPAHAFSLCPSAKTLIAQLRRSAFSLLL